MSECKHAARVLVVEDDEAYGRQLVGELRRAFAWVDHVRSGDEAVERAAAVPDRYDVVVMDQEFEEGLNGLDAMCRIRASGASTAIILLTGYGDREMALRALRLGAQCYTFKPVHPEELLANIERAYEVATLRRARATLAEQGQAWRQSAIRLGVAAGLALVAVVVLAFLAKDRFAAVAIAFVVVLVCLLAGWQPWAKVILQSTHGAADGKIEIAIAPDASQDHADP
jgi:DNA-binding response OmpR family regulator